MPQLAENPRTSVAATIKRATFAAHKEVEQLDAAGLKDLQELYERAASDLRALITAHAGQDGTLALQDLQNLLLQVEMRLDQLARARNALLDDSLKAAARLGVAPFTSTEAAVISAVVATRVSDEALQFVRTFVAADGLQLSDRIWRIDRSARDRVVNALEQAIIQGHGASQAARELLHRGQGVTGEILDKMRIADASRVAGTASDLLTKGPSSPMDHAMRLMRTEINRAHGEAYMMGGEGLPGFAGWRYLLSPAHPKPDICIRRGSFVTTRRGPVPIEKVVVGDLVLTHLGRFRPVTRLYRSSSGPRGLVRLCCQAANNRTLEVVMTPNHPVLTPQGWTQAGAMRTGGRVVCFDAATASQLQCDGAGEVGTARPSSEKTASEVEVRSTALELHDGRGVTLFRTPRTGPQGVPLPSCSPNSGAATPLSSCYRLAMPGSRPAAESWTTRAGTAPSAETDSDDACRSSGLPLPAEGSTRASSISVPCGSSWIQTPRRTSGTAAASGWWRVLRGSKLLNKTPAPAMPRGRVAQGTRLYTLGTLWSGSWPSPAPRIDDYKTAFASFAVLAPIVMGWARAALHSVRNGWRLASEQSIPFTQAHTTVEFIAPTGEEVFNLEVEGDHSYVVNGVVVHNCDLLSTQNLYGLGPGVYPARDKCPWPAHPNTLSFIVIVFEDEITDADKAGKQTSMQALQALSDEQKRGVLGVGKAEILAAGKLTQGMIRTPLSKLKARVTGLDASKRNR